MGTTSLDSILVMTHNSLCNVNFFMYRSHVTFGLLNSHQMQQLSHLHVVSKNLYSQDGGRKPVPFGALDHKMVKFLLFMIALLINIILRYRYHIFLSFDSYKYWMNLPQQWQNKTQSHHTVHTSYIYDKYQDRFPCICSWF